MMERDDIKRIADKAVDNIQARTKDMSLECRQLAAFICMGVLMGALKPIMSTNPEKVKESEIFKVMSIVLGELSASAKELGGEATEVVH